MTVFIYRVKPMVAATTFITVDRKLQLADMGAFWLLSETSFDTFLVVAGCSCSRNHYEL